MYNLFYNSFGPKAWVAILVFLLTVQTSEAGIRKGFEIGLYGGGSSVSGGKEHRIDSNRSVVSSIDEEGSAFGLRVGYNFTRYIGLDLSLGGATNYYVFSENDYDTSGIVSADHIIFFHTNGIFHPVHLFEGRVVPYLTAGAGWALFAVNSGFTYNYGGGLKIFLTDRLALRLDVKECKVDINSSSGAIPFKDSFLSREITLGVSIALGN